MVKLHAWRCQVDSGTLDCKREGGTRDTDLESDARRW